MDDAAGDGDVLEVIPETRSLLLHEETENASQIDAIDITATSFKSVIQ